MYNVPCTLYYAQCTLYNVQCTLYYIHCTCNKCMQIEFTKCKMETKGITEFVYYGDHAAWS